MEGGDAVRVAVRRQAKLGVDHIKVMVTGGIMTGNARPLICQYTQEELTAACDEARRLDKQVAAHVGSLEGVRRCVKAGVNSIEHCGWGKPDGTSGYDPRVVEGMLERGIAVGQTVSGVGRNYLLPGFAESDAEQRSALERTYEGWKAARDMRGAGVPIMLSSDAGVRNTPFHEIHLSLRFFAMMMEVTPLEALRAMTQTPAVCLGVADRVGTVERGKVADLLVLDGDPMADLNNVRRVHTVIKGGRLVVSKGRLAGLADQA